jgi:hypothetical protein
MLGARSGEGYRHPWRQAQAASSPEHATVDPSIAIKDEEESAMVVTRFQGCMRS